MREGVLAAVAAEVHGLPVPLRRGGARADGDGHATHGVDRGYLLLRRAPDLNDAREDRQRDLLRRARADVEPGRRVDAIQQFLRDSVALQLAEHSGAAP